MSVDAILKEVEALSAEEQAELMQKLREKLAADRWVPDLSDEMKAELDRRNAEADANPDDCYTVDEVIAYVKRRK